MRIPSCLSGKSHIHALRKSAGSQGQLKGKGRVLISHSLEGESQELLVGGYLDEKVSVSQIQRKEPVPWAYLREDWIQCNYLERPFHKGTIQMSEIEDGP